MSIDVIIYESGLLLLAVAALYMSGAIKKLTGIVKEKNNYWVFPAVAAVILAAAVLAHFYASVVLLPELGRHIQMFSEESVFLDAGKTESVKASIETVKNSLLMLKAFSFTCFFAASLLVAVSSWLYLKLISK
ncbi:MAG: hypothetical protein CVV21_11000 [Candidatus Goldiibacteriota bacterium HGW-Goldbacteria-1]|jgi:hypothetical protein|nr:MAG: hypothetical protein CVV21_11000 [Candidatus Goldiibacteriota bacterium HGW-Goldbacteria-1]